MPPGTLPWRSAARRGCGWSVPARPGPFICAANLFHSDLAVPLPPGLDSWRAAERYDTMRRVLEWEGETLALSDVQALLAGRKGFLCQYDRAAGRDTVWSAACDLTRRRCLLAEGNPADGLPGDSLPSGAGGQPPLTPAARLHTIERNLTKRRG